MPTAWLKFCRPKRFRPVIGIIDGIRPRKFEEQLRALTIHLTYPPSPDCRSLLGEKSPESFSLFPRVLLGIDKDELAPLTQRAWRLLQAFEKLFKMLSLSIGEGKRILGWAPWLPICSWWVHQFQPTGRNELFGDLLVVRLVGFPQRVLKLGGGQRRAVCIHQNSTNI